MNNEHFPLLLKSAINKLKNDDICKRLLVNGTLLSWIFKEIISDYKNVSLEYILNCCLPMAGYRFRNIPLHRDENQFTEDSPPNEKDISFDDLNFFSEYMEDQFEGTDILLEGTEDTSVHEGKVMFDLRFSALRPNAVNDEDVILVDLEVQNKLNNDMFKRAVYYCARMLDSQRNTRFKGAEYGKLKKVVSIWICPDCPRNLAGKIMNYQINELVNNGELPNVHEKDYYDMMEITVIYLKNEAPSGNPSCKNLLQTLFTEKLSLEEKIDILQRDYAITGIKEEKNMYNLTKMLMEIERKIGRNEGRVEGKAEECQKWVLELRKIGITPEAIMKIAGISNDEFQTIIAGS